MSHQKPSNTNKKQQGSSIAALHRQLTEKKSKLVEEGFTFGMLGSSSGGQANGTGGRPLISSRPPLAAVSPIPSPYTTNKNNTSVVSGGGGDTTVVDPYGRQLDFSVLSQRQQQQQEEQQDHHHTLNIERDDVVGDTANLHQLCAWPSSNSRRPQSNQQHNHNNMVGDITNTSRLVMTPQQQRQPLSSAHHDRNTTTSPVEVESTPTSFRQELASIQQAAAHSQHRATPILKQRRRVTLEQEALLPMRDQQYAMDGVVTDPNATTSQLSLLPPSHNNISMGASSASTTSKPLSLVALEKYISEQMTRLRFDFTKEYIAFQQQKEENLIMNATNNSTRRGGGGGGDNSYGQHQQRPTPMTAAAGVGVGDDEAIDWGGDPSVEGTVSSTKPSTAPSRHLIGSSSSSRNKGIQKGTQPGVGASRGAAGASTPSQTKRLLAPIAAASPGPNNNNGALTLPSNNRNRAQVSVVAGGDGVGGLGMQEYLEARLEVFREAGRRFCDTFNTYRGPLEAILSEYDTYATHIGAAAHVVQSRLQSQTDQLTAENEALRNSITGEQERRKVAESTVDGYVKRIAQLETDVRECVLQKELVEHDFHMASIRNKEGDHEKAVLTRKVMSLEDDIERLERELRDPRKETDRLMGQLEAKASYITTLTHQQEKVNSEMAHLRRQLIIQLEKEAQRGRPVSPASRLRAVGAARSSTPASAAAAPSSSSVAVTSMSGTMSGAAAADGEREREAHGRTRAKLAQSQEYCAMLLSQLDRWKHLFMLLLGEHRASSGISTKALDHGDLETVSDMGVDLIASSPHGKVSGGNGGPFAYTFPLQKPDGRMGVATGGGAYGLNLPQQFKLYKGQSLLAAVKYLATTNANQGGLSGVLGGGGGGTRRNSIASTNRRKSELVDSTSSVPKSILVNRGGGGGGSSPPTEAVAAPHRRPTVAGGTQSSDNLNLNSSRSESRSDPPQPTRKSSNLKRKSSVSSSVSGGVPIRSSSITRSQNNDDDDVPSSSTVVPPIINPLTLIGSSAAADSNQKSVEEDFDEMEFTPRPRGNFLNIQELNDAPSTAMKLAQAAQLIVELKLEASKLRREKDALVSLRSEEVNTAIAKLNDVYSSEGFGGVGGGGGGAYDNAEFRSVVSLADSNPISRWFVGVGDAATSSNYAYLRTVGRQRNQRFSLGTVKWHIHSFLQMSTSSAAASVVASLDKVLGAEASSSHHQSASIALSPASTGGGGDRRRSSLIPVMSSSVLASASSSAVVPRTNSPPPADGRSPPRSSGGDALAESPSQGEAAVARTFAVGGALSGVLGAVGGGLGNPLTRCGDRLAGRFASWMEDRYGKDGISMCYSFHYTMDWFAPVDVDCHTFKAILDNTMTESLLKKQYLAAARLRNEMEKQGSQYIRRKLKMEAAAPQEDAVVEGGDASTKAAPKKLSAAAAAAGHPCVLPDGSMVSPHEVPIEVARKAIVEVFGMWSKERQVELEQAMDVLDGGASIGINSMARKKKFGNKANTPIDQWGNRTVNLRKLFDNKTIGHGQMEAHFVTVLRTLWVVEAYEYTNQIIEVLLEDVTTVSGNVAPQTLVNSILQVDPNIPDHFIHEVVEAVFAPPGDVVVPLYLPEASHMVPVTDRYFIINDRDVTLPLCISRLRMLLIMRHSVAAVPFPHEPQSGPMPPPPPQYDGSNSQDE